MSCATVPTETQFQVFTSTSESLSTSFSAVVTTLPPTTITSTSVVCLDTASNPTCSSTSISTFVSTKDGSVSTSSVPVTVTVPVILTTSNPTRTLFSTSCAPSPTSSSSTSSTTSTTNTPSPTQPPPTSASSPSITFSSLTPLTFTSSSALTLSNGTVVTTDVILTTTTTPSSVVMTTPPIPSYNQGGAGKPSGKTAPIVGGVVGGVVALLAVIGGIWFIWRRSKRWDDIFDQEEQEKQERRPRMSLDGEDVQPRPYHYGLVGHSASPSPPNSPPLRAADTGHSPSNSLSMLNAPPHHSRSSSGVALPSPGSMSRSLSDLASTPSASSGHMRPNLSTSSSAAASTRPLLERPVNHTRPPSSWSVGGQTSTPGSEVLIAGNNQPALLGPRPHSAGGTLQSAPVPGSSTDPTTRSSPVNEKRRLRAALPQGAAAPTPPSPALAGPTSAVQFPPTESRAPPVSPRNPNRPSSAKSSNAVLVHVDGGPAASSAQRLPSDNNEPPAYSPT